MSSKLIEFQTAEMIKVIVNREVARIKNLLEEGKGLQGAHVASLEKLARIHSIMNADLRETRKTNQLQDLSDEDLAALDESLGDSD